VTRLMLIANLASITCVGGAVYLAATGRDGWGWFLLMGGLLVALPKGVES
jgi:hypothetical protein